MELGFFAFIFFPEFLRGFFGIFVMFVNVDIREIVLITSESTDYEFSAAIFIELLKFWCEVLLFWDVCACLVTYQGQN